MALPRKKKQSIDISIKQYINNPYRGSAFLASRQLIKRGLNQVFIELLNKNRRQFFAVPYLYNNGDVLFHVRVPSEEYKYNKLHYDVLLKVLYDPKKKYADRDVKIFSNSPSFVYTYAYAYYHSDIMVDEFASRLPVQALNQAPEIRNPLESLGFEKSTYIASRYLLDGFALNDNYVNRFGVRMNAAQEKNLFRKLGDPGKIVEIYALGRALQAKTNRPATKKKERARKSLQREFTNKAKKTAPSGKITPIGRTKPRAKITARKAKRKL